MKRREFLAHATVGTAISAGVGLTALNPFAPSRERAEAAAPDDRPETTAPDPTPTSTPAPDWHRWSADVTGEIYGLATSATGAGLYVSIANEVYRIDAETGDVDWKAESEQSIEAPVAVGDSALFAAGRQGRLLALDRESGDRRWFEDTGTFSPGRPVFHERAVVLPGRGIDAFAASDGEPLWSVSGGFTSPRTVRTGQSLLVGAGDDSAKIDLAAGIPVWQWGERQYTGGPSFNLVVDRERDLFFGTNGGSLYAVDSTDGELQWTGTDPGVFQSLCLLDDALLYHVVTEADNSMFGALDLDTNEIRWENIAPLDFSEWGLGRATADLISYDDHLVAGTEAGHVAAIDPESGEFVGSTSVLDEAIEKMHVDGGRAYLVGRSTLRGIDLSAIEMSRE